MSHKTKTRLWGIFALFAILNSSLSSCNALISGEFISAPPNIIVVLTDDMDLKLSPFLKNTTSLIAEQGATFTNYFVTSSICCPSRASMLRGQYAHNTNVLANAPPVGGFKRFFQDNKESDSLATWLNQADYRTSLIGKYLNGYPVPAGKKYLPPGWTDWHVFTFLKPDESTSLFNGYTMNENGSLVDYGYSADDYSTDVIKQKSIDFINRNSTDNTPFFLLISVYAPHGPSIPAPRHAAMFVDLEYPIGPSFNEADVTDKPALIQALTSTGDETDQYDADNLYRRRAQSLQAVDELVTEVISSLEKNEQLDNTYIIFTSDNGFHIGEHGLPPGKGLPYEEDIHVPLMIRGPAIKANSIVGQLTTNIDLAPTIAELAGIDPAKFVDGRSILNLLQPQPDPDLKWRKGFLVEMGLMEAGTSSSTTKLSAINSVNPQAVNEYPDSRYDPLLSQVGGGAYRGMRTETFLYVEYQNGELEFYDLVSDPYELNNIASGLDPKILSSLHSWLGQLQTCSAKDCRKLEETLPVELENRPWN
ncbi:MAG TPA: sulfatase [Anaerolineales bacterium]|nr:sulfatase [Anaerolineales bacterium]